MAHELSITAIGADQPGVVAGVTGALAALNANLLDTSMTILGGRFAMVLIVSVPKNVQAEAVENALEEPASRLGLDVSVHESSVTTPAGSGERFSVSVYGGDKPGIVHRFAQALAEAQVNITDLSTRFLGDSDTPVYAMLLDVAFPPGLTIEAVRATLSALAKELDIEFSINSADADIL